jgi:hypothetical protein
MEILLKDCNFPEDEAHVGLYLAKFVLDADHLWFKGTDSVDSAGHAGCSIQSRRAGGLYSVAALNLDAARSCKKDNM